MPVPRNAQCCGALSAHVNRLKIDGCVIDIRNTGGTLRTNFSEDIPGGEFAGE